MIAGGLTPLHGYGAASQSANIDHAESNLGAGLSRDIDANWLNDRGINPLLHGFN